MNLVFYERYEFQTSVISKRDFEPLDRFVVDLIRKLIVHSDTVHVQLSHLVQITDEL
jgi:hypothetical protein